jgi:hypothetical protein
MKRITSVFLTMTMFLSIFAATPVMAAEKVIDYGDQLKCFIMLMKMVIM